MDNINFKFFKKYSIIAYFKALNERISEWAYFSNLDKRFQIYSHFSAPKNGGFADKSSPLYTLNATKNLIFDVFL